MNIVLLSLYGGLHSEHGSAPNQIVFNNTYAISRLRVELSGIEPES